MAVKLEQGSSSVMADLGFSTVAAAARPLGRPGAFNPATLGTALPGASSGQLVQGGGASPSRSVQRNETIDHLSGKPVEVAALQWPSTFVAAPVGERLELSDDGTEATRTTGMGRGVCLVGPLAFDKKGLGYFEVEILELEAGRGQTMALGVFLAQPPSTKTLHMERAKDLGKGSILLGYDLPKLYVDGQEVGKNFSREWRPLKELAAGDRVGLLVDRSSQELAVFVNDRRRLTVPVAPAGAGQRWPNEIWGVLDIHGAVRSVRLQLPGGRKEPMPRGPEPSPQPSRAPGQADPVAAGTAAQPSRKRSLAAQPDGSAAPAKRPKLPAHSCGCLVHLIRHTGCTVHVPQAEFLIGRNPKVCNLTLDSALVPNMISRRHARLLCTDEGVEVSDLGSVNGTWVNGAAVERRLLAQGDVVVIGKPEQGPADFRFSVSLPSA